MSTEPSIMLNFYNEPSLSGLGLDTIFFEKNRNISENCLLLVRLTKACKVQI